jgi:molybdate transport system substrate-binding protein
MSVSRRLVLIVLIALAAGCKKSAPDKAELHVFAAASLREAFTELGAAFEKAHPGVTVAFQFAGSQELRAQIEHGAAVDVFASADTRHMGELEKAGTMVAPVTFARNEPVVVVARDQASSVALFTDVSTVSRLVVGAPDVPIGRYTDQILINVGQQMDPQLQAVIESKIVSRELNVRQVLAKVSLGEADAGIVYRTDAAAAADKVAIVAIPAEVNAIAEYPLAVARAAPHAALARQFVELVTSAAGQETLQRRGFLPATPR